MNAPARNTPIRPRNGKAGSADDVRKATGRCPVCAKPVVRQHRPFCSKRCAEIDLGRWLKGAYAVPGDPVTRVDEQDD
ncbi:MAG: DNA gyrase inhibitor YacG [Methyloceanibacter sp.]